MLALLKKLNTPRMRTLGWVLLSIATVWLTGYLGPSWGLRGPELQRVLSGEGAIATIVAAIMRSLLEGEKKPAVVSKKERAEPSAEDEKDVSDDEAE